MLILILLMFIYKYGILLFIFFLLEDNPNKIALLATINGLLKSILEFESGFVIVSHKVKLNIVLFHLNPCITLQFL